MKNQPITIPSTLPEEKALEFTDVLVIKLIKADKRIEVWHHRTHRKGEEFRSEISLTINGHVCTLSCTQNSLEEITQAQLFIDYQWCGSTHWTATTLDELPQTFLLTGKGIIDLPGYEDYMDLGRSYAMSLGDRLVHDLTTASRFLDVCHDMDTFRSNDYLHEIWIMPGMSQGIHPVRSCLAFLESIVENRFKF